MSGYQAVDERRGIEVVKVEPFEEAVNRRLAAVREKLFDLTGQYGALACQVNELKERLFGKGCECMPGLKEGSVLSPDGLCPQIIAEVEAYAAPLDLLSEMRGYLSLQLDELSMQLLAQTPKRSRE